MKQPIFLYTGVRKMYFYLVCLAVKTYVIPKYDKYHGPLPGFNASSFKNVVKFALSFNENEIKEFKNYYFKNPEHFFYLIKKIKSTRNKYFKKYKNKLSNSEEYNSDKLLKIYEESVDFIWELFYLNQIIWVIDFVFGGYLKDELNKQGFNENDLLKLVYSGRRNYIQIEEIEFFKLCVKYFKKGKILAKFLEEHLYKYAYQGISYADEKPRSVKFYYEKIKEFKKLGYTVKNFKNILKKKENENHEFLNERKKVEQAIKKDKNFKIALSISREASYLKDYFRGSLSETLYYFFNNILNEIARRKDINQIDIRELSPEEIANLFKDKEINKKFVEKRKENYFIIAKKGKIIIFYNKKAVFFDKKYFPNNTDKPNLISGVAAYKGMVRGRIKIILTINDFHKFRKGDILVSTNTMPEFVSLIAKAKAIITDVGGVTSHAAIVSREMKKPCIIGTKLATKVLHDGYLVEVDADKGIVKILKRK
jgi:phosphohistidine swiveling domain-containing protein